MQSRPLRWLPWALALAGCGQWQRVGSEPGPRPASTVPGLFDAQAVYRDMGFFTAGAPLPFVASLRFLAGEPPDSTLAVLGVSLSNQSLTFQREGNQFVAGYRVELTLRTDTSSVIQLSRDEVVRVASFQETQRPDESVIFQRLFRVPPGTYRASVSVRDRGGTAFSHSDLGVTVPDLGGPGPHVAAPLPFYQGEGRTSLSEPVRFLVNPRATVPFGLEPIRLYVEVYRAPAGARLAAEATDQSGRPFWSDTLALDGERPFEPRILEIPAPAMPVGRADVRVGLAGTDPDRWSRAPLFVSFSNQWAIANFDQLITLLRYFYPSHWVDSLRLASADDRPRVWREFWRSTDPDPVTPDNERLDEYLRRIQMANLRFTEQGDPGWLTDRGEVFVTLGEPDEALDLNTDYSASPRLIRWSYYSQRLQLYFRDETGFGRYRLLPESRAEFFRVRERVRRQQ